MATAKKIGEVKGGQTGQVYDVYYHDMSGVYRLSKHGEATSDIATRVVGSPAEALRVAQEDAKTK